MVLENVLELKLASNKLARVNSEILVILYHWNIGENSARLLDLKRKYKHLGIMPMTFVDACKGRNIV